jgi:hypothetical protein
MPGSNNFLPFNVNGQNMMSDQDYDENNARANGVSPGLASSALHNKLFRQTSFMTAALGEALAELDFTVSDANFNALVDVLVEALTPPVPATVEYIQIQDEKATNTAGGTFTSGAWRTRVLNTIKHDTGNNVVSLADNQFTLKPGTYEFEIRPPAAGVNQHQSRLRNITDGTTVAVGQSMNGQDDGSGADLIVTYSVIQGIMTIVEEKTFEVQHKAQVTKSSTGFGGAANQAEVEIYTVAVFRKIG